MLVYFSFTVAQFQGNNYMLLFFPADHLRKENQRWVGQLFKNKKGKTYLYTKYIPFYPYLKPYHGMMILYHSWSDSPITWIIRVNNCMHASIDEASILFYTYNIEFPSLLSSWRNKCWCQIKLWFSFLQNIYNKRRTCK